MPQQARKYIVIDPIKEEIRLEEHDGDHLKNMQTIVGGYIERAAQLTRKSVLLVNEDGIAMRLTPWHLTFKGQRMMFLGAGCITSMGERADGTELTPDAVREMFKVEF